MAPSKYDVIYDSPPLLKGKSEDIQRNFGATILCPMEAQRILNLKKKKKLEKALKS